MRAERKREYQQLRAANVVAERSQQQVQQLQEQVSNIMNAGIAL